MAAPKPLQAEASLRAPVPTPADRNSVLPLQAAPLQAALLQAAAPQRASPLPSRPRSRDDAVRKRRDYILGLKQWRANTEDGGRRSDS